MFEIELELFETNISKANFSLMQIDNIYQYISIEGNLVISDRGQQFFSAEVAAIEFYWYISNWYKADGLEEKLTFRYTTIEYIEPILIFSYFGNNKWKIYSPWMKSVDYILVEESFFEQGIKKLIGHLSDKLEL